MSFATLIPSRKLTAPGYFNFSRTQKPTTGKIFKWFDSANQVWIDQVNLFDSFFRLWQTRSYAAATVTRTPYVAFQLNNWGIGWFQGTDEQAAALISLVSRSYDTSTAANFQYLFQALRLPPFQWVVNPEQIIYGVQYPAYFAETLIIYSNAGSPPSTPSPTVYVERDWTAPVGWTLFASSSTYLSRGYLSGGNIIWMTPISTSVVYPFYNVATLGDLPPVGTVGALAGVEDDGTGDVGAVYYDDGSNWRKTTTPNPNQGELNPDNSVPALSPRAVASPNPDTAPEPITSNVRPPADGPSQGFGIYGGFAQLNLQANRIGLVITLTEAGFENLGIIVNLLRRIKPILNQLTLYYTIENVSTETVQVNIKDSGAVE